MTDVRPWPAVLADGAVRVRPLRRRDERAWNDLRAENLGWLAEWEATSPVPGSAPSFRRYVAQLGREARAGRALPFAIEVDGALVGQVTVAPITYGSLWVGSVGYWVAERVAGRGIAPTAVALVTDHCWTAARLHRVEVAVRPENAPSLRVVAKLGFREEGLRPRYLHIGGAWRDHRAFALTAEEVPGGLLRRWHERLRHP